MANQSIPVILSLQEAQAAQRGKLQLLVRPMRKQPESQDINGFVRHPLLPLYWMAACLRVGGRWVPTPSCQRKCPLGDTSFTLWGKEPWWNSRGDDSMPTHYKADGALEDIQIRWASAATMPQWASRAAFKVLRVSVGRLRDLSIGDILSMGVKDLGAFVDDWDKHHRSDALRFTSNPWLWKAYVR